MTIYHKGKNYFCPVCGNPLRFLKIIASPQETNITGECTMCNYDFENIKDILFIQIGEKQ